MGSCTGNLYDSSHTTHSGLYVSGPACVCGSTCSSDAQNHCEMDSQLLEREKKWCLKSSLHTVYTYKYVYKWHLCYIQLTALERAMLEQLLISCLTKESHTDWKQHDDDRHNDNYYFWVTYSC